MILIEHVVDLQPCSDLALLPSIFLLVDRLTQQFAIDVCVNIFIGPAAVVLRVAHQHSGHIKASLAVVCVELVVRPGTIFILKALVVPEAESVADSFLYPDPYDGFGSGRIAGSGVGDDLHVAYLVGCQLLDLAVVIV